MRFSSETLATVSLLELDESLSIERAVAALLSRARKSTGAMNPSQIDLPFYRLEVWERFILTALHSCRWSYSKVGRIMDLPASKVGPLAWRARLHLSELMVQETGSAKYPTGAPQSKSSCPEYFKNDPWTQKFLDDEFRGRDQMFFQNHLMACDDCRKCLNRARDFYYDIERFIPSSNDSKKELDGIQHSLTESWERIQAFNEPKELVRRSFSALTKRREVQMIFAIGFTLAMIWIFRS